MSRPLYISALFAAWCAVSPVSADDLALLPAKSTVVIQVNGIVQTQERINRMLVNAVPDKAAMLSEGIATGLGGLLKGRDLKSLRKDGRFFAAISDLEKLPDAADFVLLFPTDDLAEFKKSFLTAEERGSIKKDGNLETFVMDERESPVYLVPLKGFAAVISSKETAGDYAGGKVAAFGKALSKETASAFLGGDISIFVNVAEVNAKYGEQLKTFKNVAGVFLNQAEGMGVQGLNKEQLAQVKSLIDGVFQVIEDGVGAVIAFEFRPEGANLKLLAQFDEKSGTNKFLKSMKPSPLAEMATLPAGRATYTASNISLSDSKVVQMLSSMQAATDPDEKVQSALTKASEHLAGLSKGLSLSVTNGIGTNGMEVTIVSDAQKAVDSQIAMFKLLTARSSFANVHLKGKPVIKANALKVGEFDLTSVKMAFDLDKAVAELPEDVREITRKSMMRAVGEEMNMWIAASGNRFVTVRAPDEKAAEAILKDYLAKKSVDADPAYAFTRKQLPGEAGMLMMMDAARTTYSLYDTIRDTFGAFPGIPFQIPELKKPDEKPSYIGMALVLKDAHGSFDIFVPATAVTQIRKLLAPLIDMDN